MTSHNFEGYRMSFIAPQSAYNTGRDPLSTLRDFTLQIENPKGLTTRESDEHYSGDVLQFSPDLRITVCKDNWQWIIQRKDKTGTRWLALAYCRTKTGLNRMLNGLGISLPECWLETFTLECVQ